MDRIKEKLSAIANAIRQKTGKTELLNLEEMPAEIAAIETGITTDDATAVASDILNGKTAYVKGTKMTGTMPTATQATPAISVDSTGLITASSTQTAGYVAAGTKSATKQLTVQAAQTITPGTSNKTIASGRYLTGTQTIAGDADLVASNIKKGVNIFGVAGSYDAASEALNFKVVGGTSQPSSPTENTIWVNTSTAISNWIFSSTEPTSPTSGMVWIHTGTSSTVEFNALKNNTMQTYPMLVKQYISSSWVNKEAKTYKNGKWKDWTVYLYNSGTEIVPFSSYLAQGGAIQSNADHMLLTYNTSSTLRMVGWWTDETVDVSQYNKLYAEISCEELIGSDLANWKFQFGIFSNKLTTYLYSTAKTNMIAGTALQANHTKTIYEVDISNVTFGHIGIQGGSKAAIYKIWLE